MEVVLEESYRPIYPLLIFLVHKGLACVVLEKRSGYQYHLLSLNHENHSRFHGDADTLSWTKPVVRRTFWPDGGSRLKVAIVVIVKLCC